MKELKKILSESIVEDNVMLESFCDSIQKWTIEEFAPEVQNWIIKEFSPEIENWVKEYMNDKRTPLHISDFCGDDSNDSEVLCTSGPTKKMGTVEPEYNDDKHLITNAGIIQDDALAFIYGAIKKYGQEPELFDELKEYIINEAKYIGKYQ